jgi:hypothetical protein
MNNNHKILLIYLKGKESPIRVVATAETIMDFTDFTVSDQHGQFIFRYFDGKGKRRYMMIQNSQIQAIDFDDFDVNDK